MATRDTANLILEVDARIATAQRAVNQLARSVQQDSASMEQSLGKVATAHANIGKALNDNGRIRAGFTQLSFQIGDVTQQMALGVSGARIFAEQSGQVIQALQVMGGEGNKFLQFLGGPWGIAISTAAVILAPLASKLFATHDEVGKLVEKMREQARQAALNKQADEAWKATIEGMTEAIRKRREEQEKSLQTDIQAEQQSLADARREAANIQRQLEAEKQNLRNLQGARARAAQEVATPSSADIHQQEQSRNQLAAIDQAIATSKQTIAQLTATANEAQASVRGALAPIAERNVADSLDKVKAATDRYTVALGKLRGQLQAGKIDQAQFEKQLAAAAKTRDAEIKAANASTKSTSDANRQSGRQVDFAQAAQIARAAGLQVNSGYRSPAEQAALYNNPAVNRPGNPVAPPGASAHNGANGKWAIDIQITDGVTPGKIRKVFADQGVSLTKVLKEKGHFHIEGSRSEAAAAENDAAKQATAAEDRTQAFQAESNRLDQQILQAKNQLVQGVDGQADAAIKSLQADAKSYDDAIDKQVADGKLNAIDGETLKLKRQQLTFEQAKAVEVQRLVQHLQQQDEADQRAFQYQADDLRFADEMATTQAEHRKLQLDILDVVYQQKDAHLRALKAELEVAGKLEEAAQVQAQIDRLPTEKAHDQARTIQGTMNPLEAWAHQVPKTAAEINEALQSIEAKGLDNLTDAITGVIMGTESLKQAFGNLAKSIIADIIQMTIKMLIFKAISGLLGGAFGGGGSSLPGMSTGDMLSGNVFSFSGARAAGGPVTSGKAYLVGEKGPELFVPGASGAIVPNTPRISELRAANGNAPAAPQRVIVELNDGMLNARIADGADVQIVRRYPAMKADTMKSLNERNRRRA